MSSKSSDILDVLGRVFIGAVFFYSGLDKIGNPGRTAHAMSAHGIPGVLVWAVIALELGGALILALGLVTRVIAAVLAVYSIAAISIFLLPQHRNMTMILTEWAMVGGLFYCVAHGGGRISLDWAWLRSWSGSRPALKERPLAPRTEG